MIRTGLLSMAALVALGLTRLVHGSLVSRATDPHEYALIGTLIACATVAGMAFPAALASAATRFVAFHRGRGDAPTARAIYRRLAVAGIAGGAALTVLATTLATALLDLSAAEAAAVAALTAAYALYSVEKGALYGFDRVATYARLELACSGLAVAATVVVVAAGADVAACLAPLALGYGALALAAAAALRGEPGAPAAVAAEARREVSGYVAWTSLGILAGAGFLYGLPMLASWLVEPVEAAYVVAAVTLVAPLYLLPRALGMALFPAMAHAHGAGDVDAVRRHADVATRFLVVALAPVFAVGMLLARELLLAFGGDRYAGGVDVLQLLLAATYMTVVCVAAVNALASGRSVRIPVLSGAAGTAVGLAVAIPLAGPLDAAGLGLGYLLNVAISAAVPIAVVWRRHAMPWAGPVVRALALVLGALALARGIAALDLEGAERTAADAAGALAAAAAAAALLGRQIAALVRLARRSPAPETWQSPPAPALEGA